MGAVISVLQMILVIFPPWFAFVVFGFISLILIFVIVKVVGAILDAVPFF